MKKSTLITTIAMIVVVVVALSTATYAWFSSASTNKVSATVTTTGAGDFAISQATYGTPDAQTGVAGLSNWTVASAEINLTSTELMGGLFAPTAELTAANYGLTSASLTKSTGKFYMAESLDSNQTATIKTGATFYKPVVLRIQNTSGAAKQLKFYFDVNVGDGTNSATVYAGESVAFAMMCQDVEFNTISTLSTGYGYAGSLYQSESAPTYAEDERITTPATATTTAGYTRMAYDGIANTVGTALVAADDDSSTITKGRGGQTGEHINSQSFTISTNLANAGIVYVTLYFWIDGWRADNSAAGADDLAIGFRFYGESVSESPNP